MKPLELEIEILESQVPKEYHFGDKTKNAVKKIEGKYVQMKEKRQEKKEQKKAEKEEKRAEDIFSKNLANIDEIQHRVSSNPTSLQHSKVGKSIQEANKVK